MLPHPDQYLAQVQHRVCTYNQHAAVHRLEAEAAWRARRKAERDRLWFGLRYRFRNLMFRLAPSLANRIAM